MLTEEQKKFLEYLQEELNTQDTFCQADPRFWVVLETFDEPCWEDACDHYDLVDEDGEKLAELDHPIKDIGKLMCVPVRRVERFAPNTMFLTLREAQEHIEQNHYHYRNPRPYAMTAWRSPQVEMLVEILQSVDWEDVEPRLCECRCSGDGE